MMKKIPGTRKVRAAPMWDTGRIPAAPATLSAASTTYLVPLKLDTSYRETTSITTTSPLTKPAAAVGIRVVKIVEMFDREEGEWLTCLTGRNASV